MISYILSISQSQQYENVNNCLNLLLDLHCDVKTIKTNDICAGRLKAILTLFFSLSRYEQTSSTSHNNNKQKLGGSSTIKIQQPMPLQQQQMSQAIERWVRAKLVSKAHFQAVTANRQRCFIISVDFLCEQWKCLWILCFYKTMCVYRHFYFIGIFMLIGSYRPNSKIL